MTITRAFKVLGAGLLLAAFAGGAIAPGAGAQPGPHGAAWDRVYDPATLETVSGTVTAIDRMPSRHPGHAGVHLTLKTAQTTIPVHLGPAWYIDAQEPRLKVGDAITVKGSRVMMGGKPAIVAQSITLGDQVLVLRDEAGRPAWAGWRRRAN
jgi:hypothetical protein